MGQGQLRQLLTLYQKGRGRTHPNLTTPESDKSLNVLCARMLCEHCGRHYGRSAEAAHASWPNQVECWLAIRGTCYDDREEDRGMGTIRKYVVINPATGKLDRRIFSEQAIYDDEMERIWAPG